MMMSENSPSHDAIDRRKYRTATTKIEGIASNVTIDLLRMTNVIICVEFADENIVVYLSREWEKIYYYESWNDFLIISIHSIEYSAGTDIQSTNDENKNLAVCL